MTTKTLICVSLALSICVSAVANEQKFDAAYAAYQHHLNANEPDEARKAARTAYRIGRKLFGVESANTANLATNYAALLNDNEEPRRARNTLQGVLAVLERRYGEEAPELVPTLVELGRAHLPSERYLQDAMRYFQRAATASDLHANPLYAGIKNFDIAMALSSAGQAIASQPYIVRAYEVFERELEPADVRRGLAGYHMALWSSSREQHAEAVVHLLDSLNAFETNEPQINDLERAVRHRLVDAYERLGESHKATEHCLAIGARQDWVTPPQPLHGTPARYPQAAVEQSLSGQVQLKYTIDKSGFVRDAIVVKSSDSIFDSAALAMLQTYRYAPRFVAGEAVATEDLVLTAIFDLAASKSGSFSGDFELPPLPGFHGVRPGDPSVCGNMNDPTIDGRCRGFGQRK